MAKDSMIIDTPTTLITHFVEIDISKLSLEQIEKYILSVERCYFSDENEQNPLLTDIFYELYKNKIGLLRVRVASEQSNDDLKYHLATSLNNITGIGHESNTNENMIKILNEALEFIPKSGYRLHILLKAQIFSSIANLYLISGDHSTSESYSNLSVEEYLKIYEIYKKEDRFLLDVSKVYRNIAIANIHLHRTDKVMDAYDQAIRFTSVSYMDHKILCYKGYYGYLLSLGDPKYDSKIIAIIEELEPLLRGNLVERINLYEVKGRLYEVREKFEKAAECYFDTYKLIPKTELQLADKREELLAKFQSNFNRMSISKFIGEEENKVAEWAEKTPAQRRAAKLLVDKKTKQETPKPKPSSTLEDRIAQNRADEIARQLVEEEERENKKKGASHPEKKTKSKDKKKKKKVKKVQPKRPHIEAHTTKIEEVQVLPAEVSVVAPAFDPTVENNVKAIEVESSPAEASVVAPAFDLTVETSVKAIEVAASPAEVSVVAPAFDPTVENNVKAIEVESSPAEASVVAPASEPTVETSVSSEAILSSPSTASIAEVPSSPSTAGAAAVEEKPPHVQQQNFLPFPQLQQPMQFPPAMLPIPPQHPVARGWVNLDGKGRFLDECGRVVPPIAQAVPFFPAQQHVPFFPAPQPIPLLPIAQAVPFFPVPQPFPLLPAPPYEVVAELRSLREEVTMLREQSFAERFSRGRHYQPHLEPNHDFRTRVRHRQRQNRQNTDLPDH